MNVSDEHRFLSNAYEDAVTAGNVPNVERLLDSLMTAKLEKDEYSRHSNNCMKKGDLWCAISKEWLDSWMQFAFGKTLTRPEAIDNSSLVDENGNSVPMNELTEHLTHEWIHQTQWDLLHSWYGGGPEISTLVISVGSNTLALEACHSEENEKSHDRPIPANDGFEVKVKEDMSGPPVVESGYIPFFMNEELNLSTVRGVLILGEMDFSLSYDVVNILRYTEASILSTTYFPSDKCPSACVDDAYKNGLKLDHTEFGSASIKAGFGVDSTLLHANSSILKFAGYRSFLTDVIFAFPRNVSEGGHVQKNAELIRKTFASLSDDTVYILSGGTCVHLFLHVTKNGVEQYNSYNLDDLQGWELVYRKILPNLAALRKIFPTYVPRTCDGRKWKPEQIGIYSFRQVKKECVWEGFGCKEVEERDETTVDTSEANVSGVILAELKKFGWTLTELVNAALSADIGVATRTTTKSKNIKIDYIGFQMLFNASMTRLLSLQYML